MRILGSQTSGNTGYGQVWSSSRQSGSSRGPDSPSPYCPAADLLGCPSTSTEEQKAQVASLSLWWGLSVLHTAAHVQDLLGETINESFRPVPALHPSQEAVWFRHPSDTTVGPLGLTLLPAAVRETSLHSHAGDSNLTAPYLGPMSTLNPHTQGSLIPTQLAQPSQVNS